VGVRAQPPGFSPDPKFSLANSPVSPVDRLRLLTAPSNTASQTVLFQTGYFHGRCEAAMQWRTQRPQDPSGLSARPFCIRVRIGSTSWLQRLEWAPGCAK
jgi:hypothetical protein